MIKKDEFYLLTLERSLFLVGFIMGVVISKFLGAVAIAGFIAGYVVLWLIKCREYCYLSYKIKKNRFANHCKKDSYKQDGYDDYFV